MEGGLQHSMHFVEKNFTVPEGVSAAWVKHANDYYENEAYIHLTRSVSLSFSVTDHHLGMMG